GVEVGMDELAHGREGRGGTIHHQVVERRNKEERQQSHDDDGANRETDDPPHHAHYVGRTDAVRSPAGFPGPHADDAVEEPAVPGQPDNQRLVERVAAASTEVSNRIVALPALPADQVARMPPGGWFQGAWARPRPGYGGRD